jgi:RNA polymerase II subunit A small phosphatase-like protein
LFFFFFFFFFFCFFFFFWLFFFFFFLVSISASAQQSSSGGLLPPKSANDRNKKTLVLDLDETLIHSEFSRDAGRGCDFKVPIYVDGESGTAYVNKRPYVDEFLRWAGRHFEVVIFTASLPAYADPLLNKLDRHRVIRYRLYRHHCTNRDGDNIKDLSKIGRAAKDTILVDNAPVSYKFQKSSGIHVSSWYEDDDDEELLYLMDVLEEFVGVGDIRDHTKDHGRRSSKDKASKRAYKKKKAKRKSKAKRRARYDDTDDSYSASYESSDDDSYYSY